MNKKLFIASSLIVFFGTCLAVAEDLTKSVILKAEDREFVEVMDPISFADAFGRRDVGDHGYFGRFPANFETIKHTHTHEYHAIVLKGRMTNPFGDEKNPPVMLPGSYWRVAAGAEHTTACVSDTPCEFYVHDDKGFDFTPVEK